MYIPAILQNRTYLLAVIGFITTFAALGPFFVGHTVSTALVAHEILHIAAITFGTFLVIVSFYSYTSTKNMRLFFTMLAFTTFTFLQGYLLHLDLNTMRTHNPANTIEDVVLTIMIGLFAIGVFWYTPTSKKFS